MLQGPTPHKRGLWCRLSLMVGCCVAARCRFAEIPAVHRSTTAGVCHSGAPAQPSIRYKSYTVSDVHVQAESCLKHLFKT